MKLLFGISSIFRSYSANTMLLSAAFLSQNAVAGSGEVAGGQSAQAQPALRLAENIKGLSMRMRRSEALIKQDEANRAKAQKAGGKAGAAGTTSDVSSGKMKPK